MQTSAAAIPQLTFSIGNADAPDTIWVTTDPELNRLTLAVGTEADASFAAGRPVPYGEARGATGSLLYLNLSALQLSDAEFERVTAYAEGWETLKTPRDRRICFAPSAAVALRRGERLRLQVDHVTTARPPEGATVELAVASYRVGGITRGNAGSVTQLLAALQTPPDGGRDLHEAIALSVPQPYVIGSVGDYQDYANSLALTFAPGHRPRSIVAGDDTSFTISFVYADERPGYGALCTRTEARRIRVLAGTGTADWGISSPRGQQNRTWLLQPPSGSEIVPPDGVAELLVEDLVTTLAGGPTLMLVTYSGVPGYQDGAYAITLRKVPHVQITSFEVSPNPVVLRDGVAEVELRWTAEDAGALTLQPLYRDVTRRTSIRVTVRESTTFTLQADGIERASAGNQAAASRAVTVLPVIDSFAAAPSAIHVADFPRVCDLAWSVNTPGQVELVTSNGGPDPNRYAARAGISRSIERPQMITLVPVDTPENLVIRRSLVLSAFSPEYGTAAVAGASAVAIAPNAGFVAVADARAGTVTALDTIVYKPLGAAVPVGSAPAALAFSPDGRTLYAANGGDGTVSVLAVTAAAGWPPFALAVTHTVTVGGRPQAVAVSPDGRYLYVALAPASGDGAGTLSVVERREDGGFGRPQTLGVGRGPRAIGVAPGGAQVLVANAGDDSVTVIGVGSGGTHQRVNRLDGFRSAPSGIAYTPDNAVVLVSCAGSATVFALDARYLDTSERKALTVGARPGAIAVVPGGAYAFVACDSGDALALLSVGNAPRACSVLQKSVPAGSGASGVAVSPDAGLALLGYRSADRLGVVTLAEYTQRREPVAAGNQMTDVAVTPDAAQAFVWHDARVRFNEGTPSSGYWAYEFASQTIVQQDDGRPVIAIVPSPRRADRAAYLIATDSSAVDVVSTETYTSLFQIDVTRQTAARPRAIAVSGDGRTLFALCADAQLRYVLLPYDVDVRARTARPLGVVELFRAKGRGSEYLLAGPDAEAVWAIDSPDRQLWSVRREGGRYVKAGDPIALPALTADAAISPDGARLFALGQSGTRNTITSLTTSDRVLRTVTLPSIGAIALNGLAVSPDGTRLFATDGVQAGLRVFDAATLRLVQTISWEGATTPYGVAVTPTGTHVLAADVGDVDDDGGGGSLVIAPQVQPAALEELARAAGLADTEPQEAHADA